MARHVVSTTKVGYGIEKKEKESMENYDDNRFGEKIKLGRTRNRKSRLETDWAENGMERKEGFEQKR